MPRRATGGPQRLEAHGVLVRVHARPETHVPERIKLALRGELLQRLALEHAGVVEAIEHARFKAEETGVDPLAGARLLAEAHHAIASSSTATPNCSSGCTTVRVAAAP